MDLYPAIDLRRGKAVRLYQGDFAQETVYGDPLALAERYVTAGARWIHVVDLDAAKTGKPTNRDIVLELSNYASNRKVQIQVGGGVRDVDQVDALLGAGVHRVVIGTAALEDPVFARNSAERFPTQIAIGLDYRVLQNGTREPAVRGWVKGSGVTVKAVVEGLGEMKLGAIVVTSIAHDGTLGGPDLKGLKEVLMASEIPVIASGGVGTLAHLKTLGAMKVSRLASSDHEGSVRGLAGVIAGKSLLEGTIGIKEAVEACATSD